MVITADKIRDDTEIMRHIRHLEWKYRFKKQLGKHGLNQRSLAFRLTELQIFPGSKVDIMSSAESINANITNWMQQKRAPNQHQLDVLADPKVFNLSTQESHYWYNLLHSDFLYKFPRLDSIQHELAHYIEKIRTHDYPAYIIDTEFLRVWGYNHAAAQLVGGIENARQLMSARHRIFPQIVGTTLLELVFNSQKPFSKAVKNAHDFYSYEVNRIKQRNMRFMHRPNFLAYPWLMLPEYSGLSWRDYDNFKCLWQQVDAFDEQPTQNGAQATGVYRFAFADCSAEFDLVMEDVIPLHRDFAVIWYRPMPHESAEHHKLHTHEHAAYMLWDEVCPSQMNAMIEDYYTGASAIQVMRENHDAIEMDYERKYKNLSEM
jgi:hypothetical protein